jgi:hypothetical protein
MVKLDKVLEIIKEELWDVLVSCAKNVEDQSILIVSEVKDVGYS